MEKAVKSLTLRIWIEKDYATTYADTDTSDDSIYCITNTLLEISGIRKDFRLLYKGEPLPETLESFSPDVFHDIYVEFVE